jgi:hypothetical protein
MPALALLVLRRQGRDHRVVRVGVADLGGPARGPQVIEEFNVGLVVIGPFLGSVILVIDGFDGADRLAGTAVHALVGVDVQGTLTLIDAIDGALFNTCLVLDIYTRLRDYVRHVPGLSTLVPATAGKLLPA